MSPFKKSASALWPYGGFLAVLGSPAQAQQTLAQIEQGPEASQKAAGKTEPERMAVPYKLNCVKVFGNQSFCDCVHEVCPRR
ncbi:MAG: hypothetical protein IPO19_13750 [Rhodoferax sp.]|nr:hypothetical protein [Rhodoferax sp.]